MKNGGSGFRQALADVRPSVRQLSDTELRAFTVACLAELSRRVGPTVTASWIAIQAHRLAAMDGVTA